MNSKKFSQALEKISDELLLDALNVYKRKENRKSRWIRAAAVAATVAILLTALLWPGKTADGEPITAPGILKVYAYDTTTGSRVEDMVRSELREGVVSHPYPYTMGMNVFYGLPLTLYIADDQLSGKTITFDVSVDIGEYIADNWNDKYKKDPNDITAKWDDIQLGKAFSVDNGETIYWSNEEILNKAISWPHLSVQAIIDSYDKIKTQIIIKADGNIVGYAVVMIRYDDGWYTATVPETVFYPLIDGEFQTITEKYVRQQMKTVR